MKLLSIKNLHSAIGSKEILKGLDLEMKKGETHFIMGPNGSGKSALALSIASHPSYKVTGGKMVFEGKDITKFSPEEKAKAGLFLAMQTPPEIEGVNLFHFLKESSAALNRKSGTLMQFKEDFERNLEKVGLQNHFSERYLNFGFSGGEKKKSEILQLMTLKPKLAVLDEIDSGLDIDSLKRISNVLEQLKKSGSTFLIITHFERIARYLKPDRVNILIDGKIVHSGGPDLVKKIEKSGYESFKNTYVK